MFLTIGQIYNEDLWQKYFECANETYYNIYIHPQNPYEIQNDFFKKNIIPELIEVKWGNIWIGFMQLLKEAYKNDKNTHFLWLSDSCIPVKSLKDIYENIQKNQKSRLNIFREKSVDRGEWTIFPRCNKLLENIEKKHIGKNHAWCLLSREHVKMLINDIEYINDTILNHIKNNAPEEHIPYIYFSIKNKLDEFNIIDEDNTINCTTFTLWMYDDYLYKDNKDFWNTFTYHEINRNELDYLMSRDTGCFFARKFIKNCKVIDTNNIIINIQDYIADKICNYTFQ